MRFLAAILAFLLLVIAPAHAEKRVALVIGNGAYQNAPQLPNPPNDARDVADALKRIGFDVILGLDFGKANMDGAEIQFLAPLATLMLPCSTTAVMRCNSPGSTILFRPMQC